MTSGILLIFTILHHRGVAQAVPGAAAQEVMAGEGLAGPTQPPTVASQALPPPPPRRHPSEAMLAQEAAEKKAARKLKKAAKKVNQRGNHTRFAHSRQVVQMDGEC